MNLQKRIKRNVNMSCDSRLTTYVGDRAVCREDIMGDREALHRVIDKLAAYEDTGWQPDEILSKNN